MTDIPTHVLAGVPAEEVTMRAIPPLSGVVVLTWFEGGDKPHWMAHGPFNSERCAREYIAECNNKHRAALLVPVTWRSES